MRPCILLAILASGGLLGLGRPAFVQADDELPATSPADPQTIPSEFDAEASPLRTSVPEKRGTWSDDARLSDEVSDSCQWGSDEQEVSRVWVEADFLMWWLSQGSNPPLVSTGNPGDAVPGALGQPGTQILLGDGGLDTGNTLGGSLQAGLWLDPDRTWGVDADWFLTENATARFRRESDAAGNPPTYLPVFRADPSLNREGSFVISEPGAISFVGSIDVRRSSQLWGLEGHLARNLVRCEDQDVNLVCGLKYLSLREELTLHGVLPYVYGDPVRDEGMDEFMTANHFYGLQLGVDYQQRRGRFALDIAPKVAVGFTRANLDVDGYYIQGLGAANPITYAGAFFSQPTNIGRASHTAFAVAPEVACALSIAVTKRLVARVGYDFLYVSAVARPGDQIDRRINVTQTSGGGGVLVGPALPARDLRMDSLFAHGVNLGLEFSY
jgi:hypothetical protein